MEKILVNTIGYLYFEINTLASQMSHKIYKIPTLYFQAWLQVKQIGLQTEPQINCKMILLQNTQYRTQSLKFKGPNKSIRNSLNTSKKLKTKVPNLAKGLTEWESHNSREINSFHWSVGTGRCESNLGKLYRSVSTELHNKPRSSKGWLSHDESVMWSVKHITV